MADTNNNPNPNTDDSNSTPPYIFIATPILLFIVVTFIACMIQIRRRRRLLALGLWPPPRPYFGSNSERGPMRHFFFPEERRGRDAAAGTRNADGSLAVRPEEGLNELGEAPPPYDPAVKQGKVKGDGDQTRSGGVRDVEAGRGVEGPPGYRPMWEGSDGTDERGERSQVGDVLRPPPAAAIRP